MGALSVHVLASAPIGNEDSRVSPTRTIARRIAAAVLGAAFVSGVNAAQGQPANWPTRPIKIITPLSAGGAADVLGRTVGDELFAKLKQPVVIENRPGGGGMLAASTVARAVADGLLTITPVLSKNVTFDPLQDFAPITNAVESPIGLVVHKSLAVNSVAELITYAKANPGKLSFGSSGPNTTHHLAGEFLKRQAGIEMIHVPYRGGNPAMTDLLAG
jgi:tripartite-type tricarboxylate transporter receptor subunit TctC